MPRSAASAAHARDAQRLDHVDRQRADARLRAVFGNAARREHRPLHAVVHDRERAVDDAAVGVHGHARREVVVLGVAVEPEPVVVVRVAARRVRDRQRRSGGSDSRRTVSARVGRYAQHASEPPHRTRRSPRARRPTSRVKARSVTCMSVAPAATSSGTDAMLRARSGRPSSPVAMRSGACTCSVGGIAARGRARVP